MKYKKEIDKFLDDHQLFMRFIEDVIDGSSDDEFCTAREAGNLLNFLICFVCDLDVKYKYLVVEFSEGLGL